MEIITDRIGAYFFLRKFFKKSDLCQELAEQVLAQKWFEDIDIWEI